jgi:predicted  nucleic acid-binding Zn-ribbon protein
MTEPSLELIQAMLQQVLDGQRDARSDVSDLKLRMRVMEQRFGALENRFSAMEERMARVEERLDRIERRLGLVEA